MSRCSVFLHARTHTPHSARTRHRARARAHGEIQRETHAPVGHDGRGAALAEEQVRDEERAVLAFVERRRDDLVRDNEHDLVRRALRGREARVFRVCVRACSCACMRVRAGSHETKHATKMRSNHACGIEVWRAPRQSTRVKSHLMCARTATARTHTHARACRIELASSVHTTPLLQPWPASA